MALLLLLASVFFSGFVLPVDQFAPGCDSSSPTAARDARHPPVAGLHAARHTNAVWQMIVLAAIGVVLFILTTITLRRNLAPA